MENENLVPMFTFHGDTGYIGHFCRDQFVLLLNQQFITKSANLKEKISQNLISHKDKGFSNILTLRSF